MPKRGLPVGLQMRHDVHYVEELGGHRPIPVGRFIAVDALEPNPEQPRVEIGDLSELTASIKDKGVLEPLLVRPSEHIGGRWMIIAGERRWRAACAAGLREVPCIEMDVDDRAVAEIALIENLQRKDLTAWEEADGLLALCEKFNYTHEEVARKLGKSRSTVTEAISIASLPETVRERCRRADINAKSVLLQIVRQPDEPAMERMVGQIAGRGLTRDEARATRRAQQGRVSSDSGVPISSVVSSVAAVATKGSTPFAFKYHAPNRQFQIEVKFRRARVETKEVIASLEAAIAHLRVASDNEIQVGGSNPVEVGLVD